MNEKKYVYFLYQKDFSEKGGDRYFLYENGVFSEVKSSDIISLDCFVITHDFWLISNSLYKEQERLPKHIIDVVLLAKIITGAKSSNSDTQPWDISKGIKPLFKDAIDFDRYVNMYYRRETLDLDVYMLFSHKLAEYANLLFDKSSEFNEYDRFFSIELPVFNMLTLSACKGIRVCRETIKKHKEFLKLEYYREIKSFAEKHNVLYEIPTKEYILEKLAKLGYDVEDYSLDFLIDFLPSKDGYTDNLRSLQKTNKSYRVFNSISSSRSRIMPIVESHWTSTARIYHKSPSIQNISKRYRDIFVADNGFSLCYVDYDQFEVGIMAALSDDPKMKYIYENMDAYNDLAKNVFNNSGFRKKAKIMFLSYTYGMSLENILSSVVELGGDQKKAKEYFSGFHIFEAWKQSICDEFKNTGKISTIYANYLNRQQVGELSNKEKRTAVNHVIQGSATYIFKKALLELNKLDDVQVLIPMHDAAFFQHSDKFDPKQAVIIFEETMTDILARKVKGKASLEQFFQSED